MMVRRKVSSKKTSAGYKIDVWVKDGRHVKPLLRVIERYFVEADKVLNKQSDLRDGGDVEGFVNDVKHARVLDG